MTPNLPNKHISSGQNYNSNEQRIPALKYLT